MSDGDATRAGACMSTCRPRTAARAIDGGAPDKPGIAFQVAVQTVPRIQSPGRASQSAASHPEMTGSHVVSGVFLDLAMTGNRLYVALDDAETRN